MTDLDALGRRHRKLLADLKQLRAELADAITAEHASGATQLELAQRSGYGSVETIRRILNPKAREAVNKARRVR